MLNQIPSFLALQQEIRDDLRVQHPDWVNPDGSSPLCDSYEERFAELLHLFSTQEDQRSAA